MDVDDRVRAPDLPGGFVLRGARPEDAAAAHALVVAHHRDSGGNEAPPLSEVVTDLTYPSLDLDRNTFFVTGSDGRPVLYGIAYTEQRGSTFFDLFVDPALPRETALALAASIAGRAIDLTVEVARGYGLERTVAETGMVKGDRLLPDALSPLGLAPARLWWRMHADADVMRAAVPDVPDGFAVTPVDATDDDVLRATLQLRNTTFHDHYGHSDLDWDTYARVVRTPASFDPTALWFAVDDATGDPVAFLFGDNSRADTGTGSVSTLGVLDAYRGRGLGSALLRTAFGEYARRGLTSVILGVDTENATGAVGVYRSVGMTVLDVIETWELALELG